MESVRFFHPSFGHYVTAGLSEVSDDPDTQVGQVIGMMSDYSTSDGNTAELGRDAARAAALGGTGNPAIDTFWFVKPRVRFVPDDVTAAPFASWRAGPIVETLIRPLDLRRMIDPQGDCDDFSMLTAALLVAACVPVSFCTVAVDRLDPGRYSHVYAVAYLDGVRIPLDTSHGPRPGWEVPNLFGKRREWPLSAASIDGRVWIVAGAVAIAAGLWLAGPYIRRGRV